MSTRLRRFWNRRIVPWRGYLYRPRLTSCGANFRPRGPLIIRNQGIIDIGDNFISESFPYSPIVFDVEAGAKLTIGNNVFMNQGVHISSSTTVTIGDDCLLAREVFIIDNDWHGVGDRETKKAPITIQAKVWICSRAIILRGVTLGEGCVVAAGAVVTRSVPPHTVVGGVPAKAIQSV